MMKPILYAIVASPPCRSVVLTAKAIGLELQVKALDYEKNEHKEDWFLKINPNHTLPALDDDGFHLWESRSIMTYLVGKYSKSDSLYPKDLKKRALVDQWMQFDLCWLYQAVCDYLFAPTFLNEEVKPAKGKLLNEKLEVMNKQLESNSYVAGNVMTLADFCVLQSVATCEVYDVDMKPYPAVNKWHKNLRSQLPFYDECMKEGIEKLKTYIKK